MKTIFKFLLFCLVASSVHAQRATYTDYSTEPQIVTSQGKERFHLFMPGAMTLTGSDQVGINGTPRWSVDGDFHPAWLIQNSTPFREYLSFRGYVDLDNVANANPNSINGSIQTNFRYTNGLNRTFFRVPEINSDVVGLEYDYSTSTTNYVSGFDVLEPFVVTKHSYLVVKGGVGVLAGHHIRLNNVSNTNPILRLSNRAQVTFQTPDGFSASLKVKQALPFYDEPITVSNGSSIKPTMTSGTTPRNFVTATLAKRLSPLTAVTVTYKYGELPPSFWVVKHSLVIGLTVTTGKNRTE